MSISSETLATTRALALQARRNIIHMAWKSKGPHVGTALSCTDFLGVLYGAVLRLDDWDSRDIFILSKGHGAMSLYGTLAAKGIIDPVLMDLYCQDKGTLPGHLDRFSVKGVEVSAGSLGHGFNVGLGLAHAFKLQGNDRKVYVVIGDGELQEGSIWEGLLFASKLGLDNFTVLLDRNDLQGYGRPSEICSMEPVAAKVDAFGWDVKEVNGHDHAALLEAITAPRRGLPRFIIGRTTKGKGVSFMEDQLVWHYYIVTDEFRQQALEELV
ncbi:MAG: transketolase [Rhodocyclaceae bacterium]|nr:transketolase [Rhodocyclaceae bacterium]